MLVTRHARTLAIAVLACLPLLVLTPGAPDADRPVATEAVRLTGGTATPSPSPGAASPTGPALRTVTIALSGDILVHDNVWASAASAARRTGARDFDFRPMLAPLRPVLSAADLAICHLETPLAPAGGPYSGYPLFSAPPQVVDALDWVGYDACSTASNHSVDQGFAGHHAHPRHARPVRARPHRVGAHRRRRPAVRPSSTCTASRSPGSATPTAPTACRWTPTSPGRST